ncbi:MAG: AAA family ATPase [Polyangiales bacterium]|jgi:aminoglycoside phosphotransferase family enzyme/predicted kinase
MGNLKTDLEASGFELVETHISWVFIGATEVFKLKRPVDLGFLDFTTLEKRHEACEAEVRLNRRLAPQVYLGVVPITVDALGQHTIQGRGTVVEWAVHMRRLPIERRADELLRAGLLDETHVDALADHIARFHHEARCDTETSRHGRVATIRRNIEENFQQTRGAIGDYLSEEQAREIETWQLETLGDGKRFVSRMDAGRIRDGHGDLRLEHVYFEADGSITIIDCIEFNDRFRYGDVCADIAFLSMDLAWHGCVNLAERFLARYARESDDYDLYSVVDFYESYRAFVRGKVASLLASDEEASAEARERARREARRYFLLALAYERPPLVPPRVVAVAGMIGSGKSRAAAAIGALLAAPVLSSDRTRKHLMGRKPTESISSEAWSGAYSPRATEAVYEELWRLAEAVLRSGRPVVIDASLRTRALRDTARRLAHQHDVPFVLVECMAPREVLRARLAERESKGLHESDARSDLLDEFEKRFEPIDELSPSEHLRLDTSRPQEETRRHLAALFEG